MSLPAERPPLTDSPWFWLYIFATAALAALALAAPKFEVRQAQVESKLQARQRAVQNLSGETPDVAVSTPGHTRLTLAPLFILFGLASAIGWTILWWRRYRAPFRAPQPEPQTKDGLP